MTEFALMLVGIAAVIGGAVNVLAGGGTLLTFPMLTAVGIPTVAANITNTVALVCWFRCDLSLYRSLWFLIERGLLGVTDRLILGVLKARNKACVVTPFSE